MTKHITRYYVFLDSNSIRDEQWIKRGLFDRLQKIRSEKLAEIRFYLPEIVSQEWVQHYTTISTSHISQVNRFDRQLSEMNIKEHSPIQMGLEEIEKTAMKLLRANKVSVIKTPYNEIDWPEILDLAVKHSPPFHPETDKGIKDAVFAKTIMHYAERNKNRPNQQIVAITYDKTLKQYIEKISKDLPIVHYSTIEAFASDLRLKVDELSTELQRQASNLFFTLDDASTLYNKFNVYDEIKRLYESNMLPDGPRKHIMDFPPEKIKGNYGLPNDESWRPLDSKPYIIGTSFIKRNGATLHWNTILNFKQAYALSTFNPHDGMVFNNPSAIIHITQFKVSWTTRIKTNKLSSSKLTSVELIDESAEIEEFPGIDYQTGTTYLTRNLPQSGLASLESIRKMLTNNFDMSQMSRISETLKSISTTTPPLPTTSILQALASIPKTSPFESNDKT